MISILKLDNYIPALFYRNSDAHDGYQRGEKDFFRKRVLESDKRKRNSHQRDNFFGVAEMKPLEKGVEQTTERQSGQGAYQNRNGNQDKFRNGHFSQRKSIWNNEI